MGRLDGCLDNTASAAEPPAQRVQNQQRSDQQSGGAHGSVASLPQFPIWRNAQM